MSNEFDPYREALVLEQWTVWPDALEHLPAADKQQLEAQLHAAPKEAAELAYVRTHTGFARQITVTEAELARLGVKVG
ncbi:MAG: hypothetical protein K8T91_17875 [Planctomycetes bacterium]|nr:hypothetical protein [Planctomycetota bacterium]